MDIEVDTLFEEAAEYQHQGKLEQAGVLYSRVLANEPQHQQSLINVISIIYSLPSKQALRVLLDLQKRPLSILVFNLNWVNYSNNWDIEEKLSRYS